MTDYIHVSDGGEVSFIPGDYIVTCDEETASWIGNDADSMRLLVRCRDCRRYHPKEGEMLSCRFEYNGFVQWRSAEPDGFCKWGKPREES